MIAGYTLLAHAAGLIGLFLSLRSRPLRLVACAALGACAAFAASVLVNLEPALGMPLFGAWLVGSAAQAGCLVAVLSKSPVSSHQAVAAACLVVTNGMNLWFGVEFFKAMG